MRWWLPLAALLVGAAAGASGLGLVAARKMTVIEQRDATIRELQLTSAVLAAKLTEARPPLPEAQRATDVHDLLQVEDAAAARGELRRFLFGADSLPGVRPTVKDLGQAGTEAWERLRGDLDRLERWTLAQDHGIDSHALAFFPRVASGPVVVYHQGHNGDVANGAETIATLVRAGHPVVALAMPLLGPNPQPVIDHPRLGRMALDDHGDLAHLEAGDGSPLAWFLTPVVAAINRLEDRGLTDDLAAVGFSGGGWTLTLAAAVDERLQTTIDVAGSLPRYLRAGRDRGDWEQDAPGLLARATYPEQYLLAAAGGRRYLHVRNRRDRCCFAGDEAAGYMPAVTAAAAGHGGAVATWIDDSHDQHTLSPAVAAAIVALLAGAPLADRVFE